ncbi:MAG TPA: DUF4832 domain-containing protein [bacterium]|nr:DUF4832 domain-containing protein [bacterium]HQG44628.1 DUF4832 domain-containing protein [bacterium]HQI48093.1 DUF4832 domain-containing protein [bacterium]HQJ63722.1 DUF4832 domain-containing protein [bacterium]
MNRCLIALSFALAVAVAAQEPSLKQIDFAESAEIFPNPERGFYRYANLPNLSTLPDLQKEAVTLIFGRIAANSYREKDFPSSYLTQIQRGFDTARAKGVKVNVRVSYCDDIGQADASKEQIFRHIDQLQPLLAKNKDVINLVEAGFIGAWGEWHSSTHGLDTPENRREILFKLLSALPADRMAVVRTPHYKRQIFRDSVITADRAFDGSYLSRTGFHNDCFLAGPDDMGTYIERSRAKEIEYISGETRFTPFGGETCGVSSYAQCRNAVAEMEKLHCSYLNDGYHPDVLALWKSSGCLADLKRRLGYRLVLRGAQLPETVRPGGRLAFTFAIENVGFAAPHNPRSLFLVLRDAATGREASASISLDPRSWLPGDTLTFSRQFRIPADWPAGTASVALWLPDPEPSLRNDPRYAIRFANSGIWEQSRGVNRIADQLLIDPNAPGEADLQARELIEIGPLAHVGSRSSLPAAFVLGAFPNPFNSQITIQYQLPQAEAVRLEICNLHGRSVSTLVEGQQSAGWHTVQWDGRCGGSQAASGIYLIRLKTASSETVKNIVLTR